MTIHAGEVAGMAVDGGWLTGEAPHSGRSLKFMTLEKNEDMDMGMRWGHYYYTIITIHGGGGYEILVLFTCLLDASSFPYLSPFIIIFIVIFILFIIFIIIFIILIFDSIHFLYFLILIYTPVPPTIITHNLLQRP